MHSSYLTGKLLVAMPSMTDPRFERAVILMCAHDEHGAMGLVINRDMGGLSFHSMLDQLGVTSDIEVNLSDSDIQVMNGGPLETMRGFLVHSSEFSKSETLKLDDIISITGTLDVLKDVAIGQGPDKMLFVLGYAGWDAGQLEQELKQNTWLVSDTDLDIVFHAQHEHKWSGAISKLGVDPAMISSMTGQA